MKKQSSLGFSVFFYRSRYTHIIFAIIRIIEELQWIINVYHQLIIPYIIC